MKRLIFVLMIIGIFSACQNSNIKDRLRGNGAGDVRDDDIAVAETTVQELEIDEEDLEGVVVREGTIVARDGGGEAEDVEMTFSYDQDDEYESEDDSSQVPENTTVMKRVSGYRIQLITVTKKENAESFGQEFREKWTEASKDKENDDAYYYKDEVPVYIEFYEPYWKLRIGNYTTRSEAEKELEFIKKLEYEDAWVVRTVILVKE